jgi:metal-responsive CopG/Arc/MetJ family transcriptional regulator
MWYDVTVEDNEIVRITVSLPGPLVDQLDQYAAGRRWSRSTAAAELIEWGLTERGRGAGQEDPVESR